jgi:hypothetical protein
MGEATLAPRLALVGNVVVEADTVGTDDPKFVCRVEFGNGHDDQVRNTAIAMLMVKVYNQHVKEDPDDEV